MKPDLDLKGRGPYARYESPTAVVSKPELSKGRTKELLSYFNKHYIFEGIRYEYIIRLIQRMQMYTVSPGEFIVTEGSPAVNLYWLIEGLLEVTVEGVVVREIRPITCFGELALLLDSNRTATVRTLERSVLYVVDKKNFDIMMDEITMDNFDSILAFVRTVPLFSSFEGALAENLVRTSHLLHYDKDKVICKENEKSYLMYVIKKGTVNLYKNSNLIQDIQIGDFFGEQALLYDLPSSATAIAAEDCELLALTKDHLDIVMNRVSKPILYKNVLRVAFLRSQTLKRLRDNQVETVLKHFTVKSYSAGETVIPHGTLVGSLMLVVLKGSLNCEDRIYMPFECIGDSGMRKQQQFPFRHAVVAQEEVFTGEITRERFEKALGGSLLEQKNDLWAFLSSVPLFSNLPGDQMTQLINVRPT